MAVAAGEAEAAVADALGVFPHLEGDLAGGAGFFGFEEAAGPGAGTASPDGIAVGAEVSVVVVLDISGGRVYATSVGLNSSLSCVVLCRRSEVGRLAV